MSYWILLSLKCGFEDSSKKSEMKKLVTYILLFTFIGATLHIDEVAKLHYLMVHYKEHKVLHPHDTFYTFIEKHYTSHEKFDSPNDEKRDAQLPYKSSQNFHSNFTPFIFENLHTSLFTIVCNGEIMFAFLSPAITKAFIAIWQPPQLS